MTWVTSNNFFIDTSLKILSIKLVVEKHLSILNKTMILYLFGVDLSDLVSNRGMN